MTKNGWLRRLGESKECHSKWPQPSMRSDKKKILWVIQHGLMAVNWFGVGWRAMTLSIMHALPSCWRGKVLSWLEMSWICAELTKLHSCLCQQFIAKEPHSLQSDWRIGVLSPTLSWRYSKDVCSRDCSRQEVFINFKKSFKAEMPCSQNSCGSPRPWYFAGACHKASG